MAIWQFESFTYDSRSGELRSGNQAGVILRHKVAQLLTYFLEHSQAPASKEELLDNLWQHGDYRERSLTQSIRELRQALGDSAAEPTFIRTLPGRGYQWIAKARQIDASRSDAVPQVKKRRIILLVVATLAVAVAVAFAWFSVQSVKSTSDKTASTPSLMVLPFANHTGDTALDWLQLGYADMLAKTLARTQRVHITPPSTAAGLLLGAGLDWPTLPVYIQSLLQERGIDAALIASVRQLQTAQVIDFQILSADGSVQQGSITYPSLTDATAEVAGQLLQLITPNSSEIRPELIVKGNAADAALARRVLAEGINALETKGPVRANELFQAANLLAKDNPWVTACRAKTELLTGQWDSAREKLQQLQTLPSPTPLKAFIQFWTATLAFREGRVHDADKLLTPTIEIAKDSHSVDILAEAYHLKAEIAWQQQRWNDYQNWRELASQTLPNSDDLALEASRLLYLGSPLKQDTGLEPEGKTQQQRIEQLKRALDFYQTLNNQPKIALSHLALARNEALPPQTREQHLSQALELFTALGQPYELAEAQIYSAFFYLQNHRGDDALSVITQAQAGTADLESYRNRQVLDFYHAFALLDLGLDLTHLGLHSDQPERLEQAVAAFGHLLTESLPPMLHAQALVLQGWGLASLGKQEEALQNYQQAMGISKAKELYTTFGYAVYSAMYSHLSQGNYQAVLALGNESVHARQQLAYLARAYYEQGQFTLAKNTLMNIENVFADQWGDADRKKLQQYSQAEADNFKKILPPEQPAHGIYCETNWLINR